MPKFEKYKRLFDRAQEHIMNRDHRRSGYRDDGGGGGESGGGGGWRGRRGRGGRGRGRGRDRNFGDGGGGGGGGRGGEEGGDRERPPPGLSGREIGMWYARRSKARKAEQEKVNRPTVAMNQQRENNIRRLLNNIEQADNVPPQMFRDFDRDMDDGGEDDSGWWEGATPSSSKAASSSRPSTATSADIVDNWEELDEDDTGEGSDRRRDKSSDRKPASAISSKQNSSRDSAGGSALGGPAVSHGSSSGGDDSFRGSRPSTSQGLARSSSSGGFQGGAEEDEDLDMDEEVPQVAGLLEYERAHGDAIFMGDEVMEEYPQEDLDSLGPEPIEALDRRLLQQSEDRLADRKFKTMLDFRKKLPSYGMRKDLVGLIESSQVVVVSGETGCGKTTQVPQFILDDYVERGKGSQCHIICTQPRRISAVSVAERVAAERCEKCGGDDSSVGYQIRLEVRQPRKQGSMLFCTTGIVLKFLEGDPLLRRTTHIILDEIHERDLQSDFLMIILKDLLPRRPDLKIILMSATLNAEMFSKYFHKCPMINIPGFTYPVQEFLLEDVLEMTKYQPNPDNRRKPRRSFKRVDREKEQEEEWNYQAWLRNMEGSYSRSTIEALRNFDYSKIDLDLVVTLIQYIVTKKEDGAILVFVPGWEEISNLHKMLQASSFASGCRVIPLHSLMPTVNQREVFDRPPPGVRKIVIATNIAETSITIDDVVFVVDCGKIKVKDYDPSTNLTCLEPQWVSRANSRQRRGRAGRVQDGYCFHLYTGLKWLEMIDYLPPEMLRTRLEELCLQIKLLKLGRIEPFVSKAMQPPSMEALHKAIVTLQELNALDREENLLPLGVHLARMPVDPHTGKMILFGAMFCCLDPILTVAASLSFKDAFVIPLGKEKEADKARKELAEGSKSDHLVLINAMKGWERSLSRGSDRQYCWDNFLSANTLRMLKDMKKQLAELLYDLNFVSSKNPREHQSNIHSGDHSLVKAVLCAGLYPHVAKVAKAPRPGDPPYKMVSLHTKDGRGKVAVHPKSVNCRETTFESKWLVYYHMLKTTQVYVHDCTMVSPYPLLFFGGNISILKDSGQNCIAVDEWIIFKASPSTAQLVKDLRQQLDRLLEEKIVRPGVTNWNESEKEGALMRAIAELISTEEVDGGEGGWEGKGARR
ncbi:ATP-dependent DNA/RNA helicase DHX36-like [Babylonia areolata]|uniref:ATP-dependent DNA/RNA helicase DHX36-like n=1 Tax=Babylonia areolata TaxID=304850 RepID=UPI003FD48FEF